jgi:hypothetical protein
VGPEGETEHGLGALDALAVVEERNDRSAL